MDHDISSSQCGFHGIPVTDIPEDEIDIGAIAI
jgi:hypothetical protein